MNARRENSEGIEENYENDIDQIDEDEASNEADSENANLIQLLISALENKDQNNKLEEEDDSKENELYNDNEPSIENYKVPNDFNNIALNYHLIKDYLEDKENSELNSDDVISEVEPDSANLDYDPNDSSEISISDQNLNQIMKQIDTKYPSEDYADYEEINYDSEIDDNSAEQPKISDQDLIELYKQYESYKPLKTNFETIRNVFKPIQKKDLTAMLKQLDDYDSDEKIEEQPEFANGKILII